ncbi:hypothetical protein D3C77_666830 [compost metagenome]
MGTGAAGGQHHPGELFTAMFDLLRQFKAGTHITQGTECVGAANRHDVGFAAAGVQAHGQGLQLLIGIVEVVDQLDLGIEQLQQQAVAVVLVVG